MYAKIFSQIFDSSLADDYQTRHVFMDLLVLADKDGFVDMTAEAIARRTNVPVNIVNESLCKLCKQDVNSRSHEQEGARLIAIDPERNWGWQIVNFQHYHQIRNEDARREYMRDYMRKRREQKEACKQLLTPVNTCKQQLAHIDIDIDTDKDIKRYCSPKGERSDEKPFFEQFWETWPKHFRKTSKSKCLAAWKKDKLDSKADHILAVVNKLKTMPQWTGEGGKFIPAPLVWLNNKRWDCKVEDMVDQQNLVGGKPLKQVLAEIHAADPKYIEECKREEARRHAIASGNR